MELLPVIILGFWVYALYWNHITFKRLNFFLGRVHRQVMQGNPVAKRICMTFHKQPSYLKLLVYNMFIIDEAQLFEEYEQFYRLAQDEAIPYDNKVWWWG